MHPFFDGISHRYAVETAADTAPTIFDGESKAQSICAAYIDLYSVTLTYRYIMPDIYNACLSIYFIVAVFFVVFS